MQRLFDFIAIFSGKLEEGEKEKTLFFSRVNHDEQKSRLFEHAEGSSFEASSCSTEYLSAFR